MLWLEGIFGWKMFCAGYVTQRRSLLFAIHLFTACAFSYGVWSSVSNWLKIGPFFAFDFRDILKLYKQVKMGKEGKKIAHGIVLAACWAIWKARNDKIFRGKVPKVAEVVSCVKSVSFLWLKHRSRHKHIRWKDWCIFPLYML